MTSDELKAAAKRYAADDYNDRRTWCTVDGGPRVYNFSMRKVEDAVSLADYAAAMLDETPLTRKWVVKLLGEPVEEFHGLETWSRDPKAGPWIDRRPDGQVAGMFNEGEKHIVETRADALAFFKLVRWPVEVGKILEGAK